MGIKLAGAVVSLMKAIYANFNKANECLSVISALAVVVAMFAILIDVAGRLLKMPVLGVHEFNTLLVGMCVYLAIGFVQNKKRNITVLLLTDRLPSRAAAILDIPVLAVCVCLFGWISYLYYQEAKASYLIREVAEGIIRFPVFPLKFVMFFGVVVLTIQLVIDIIKRLLEILTAPAAQINIENRPRKK